MIPLSRFDMALPQPIGRQMLRRSFDLRDAIASVRYHIRSRQAAEVIVRANGLTSPITSEGI